VDWIIETNLLMDHVTPLTGLTIDFLLNYQPFVKRHAFILMGIMKLYLIVIGAYSLAGRAPYEMDLWDSVGGLTSIVCTFCIGVVLFYLLEIITRFKLERGGNSLIVSILTTKDKSSDYKFSQHSDASNSLKNVHPQQHEFDINDYTGKLSKATIQLDGS
jgi:hypothetical protein